MYVNIIFMCVVTICLFINAKSINTGRMLNKSSIEISQDFVFPVKAFDGNKTDCFDVNYNKPVGFIAKGSFSTLVATVYIKIFDTFDKTAHYDLYFIQHGNNLLCDLNKTGKSLIEGSLYNEYICNSPKKTFQNPIIYLKVKTGEGNGLEICEIQIFVKDLIPFSQNENLSNQMPQTKHFSSVSNSLENKDANSTSTTKKVNVKLAVILSSSIGAILLLLSSVIICNYYRWSRYKETNKNVNNQTQHNTRESSRYSNSVFINENVIMEENETPKLSSFSIVENFNYDINPNVRKDSLVFERDINENCETNTRSTEMQSVCKEAGYNMEKINGNDTDVMIDNEMYNSM